jgi:hypothetical protein
MKPDFLTQSAVGLAIYYFYYPDNVRRSNFRALTALVFISIAYDLVWIYFIQDFSDSKSSNDRNEA